MVQVAAITTPAVVAFALAAVNARSSRNLAHDQRLADRRAETYLMLANHVVRLRQYALVAFPHISHDDPVMPPPISEDDLYQLHAAVEVFGSEAVREIYDKLLRATARTRTTVDVFGEAKEMSPPYTPADQQHRSQALEDARNARHALSSLSAETLDLLNAELKTSKPRQGK